MSERSTVAPAGLVARDGSHAEVPLLGVTVVAEISGLCSRVVTTQRYVNRETTPIEAVYVFPLEEGAAVCGFEAIVDDTLVVGEVMERDKAFEEYDDAMAEGHGAFLLDEERPDVFQASVGNLPPGKEVLLKLTYVAELATDPTGLRFAIPTTVSPRYAPAEDRTGVGRPDAETLNPEVTWTVPYGLNLTARVAMPERICRLESPSHPISVSVDGCVATVTLSQKEAALDRDFVLSVETKAFDRPQAWVERDAEGGSAVAVGFVPKFDTGSSPSELILLVDRSGSMAGKSIQEVRNALQLCLRSMTPGCSFNIVGFGSTYESLFPESRPYNDGSLAVANAHVTSLDANLGGTEILSALRFALEGRPCEGLPRQIVVLTDGEVTNTDAVLELAARHASHARIFTFGIGAGASHHLVNGLARKGGGSAEFIYPGESIERKVVRQFGRLLSPALTGVQVDWDGLSATQAPTALPPVFSGGRLVVYGFVRDARPATVRLTGRSPSGPFAFEVPVDPATSTDGRTIATLAARTRIRELEESPDWLATRGSRQGRRVESRATQEIVALSRKYGLMSRETSFVAIEHRDQPVVEDVQLRRVPIALTTGWGGLESRALMFMTSPPPQAAYRRTRADGIVMGGGEPTVERASFSVAYRDQSSAPVRAERPAPPYRGAAPPAMQALVSLQRADGSWELDDKLSAVVGRALRDLERQLAGAHGSSEEVRRAWATALALTWLREHAAEFEDEWGMLARKAQKWIDEVEATPPGGWTWTGTAREFLGREP